jgi:hypothetical protein
LNYASFFEEKNQKKWGGLMENEGGMTIFEGSEIDNQ